MDGLDGALVGVLVEGVSDRTALETLAVRRGRNLAAEGVSVVAVGGAQAIGTVLRQVRAQGRRVELAGLCDAGEELRVRRAIEREWLSPGLTREAMEELGFFVCEADLEDELIRSLGTEAVEDVLATHGDLASFRTLQRQPQWRGRPKQEQLRRFMGSGGSRKIKYARLLVEALDLSAAPRPLDAVLAHTDRTRRAARTSVPGTPGLHPAYR